MLKVFLVGMMVTLTTGFGLVAWVTLRPPPAPVVAEAAPSAPPPVAKVMVVAVTRSVRVGELMKPEDICAAELPATAVPDGAQPDSPIARADMVGAMVRRTMAALQPVLAGDMLRPTDGGFLAAVLAPQHRAVSIAVDAVSGTAGLIWPGDRVDLILTQTLDQGATTPVGRRTFGETVLRDVRVIAVDQQLARGVTPDTAVNTQTQGNRTVTLEVLPEAAERVAVAVRLGKVALSVRAADNAQPPEAAPPAMAAGQGAPVIRNVAQVSPVPGQGTAPGAVSAASPGSAAPSALRPPPTTWGQDVSPGLNQRPAGPSGEARTVRVFTGSAAEKEFKFE